MVHTGRYFLSSLPSSWGWSGGAKVLGKLSVPGRPTSLDDGRKRAYCTCSRCRWGFVWTFFSRLFSFLSPFLWETARYRLKYCLKGPLNPKQPTNHPSSFIHIYNGTYRASNIPIMSSFISILIGSG